MNILVTGGRGQLGLSLQKISHEYPQHTFIFTDMPEGDITDRAAVERLVGENHTDIIVNCAAHTAVDRAESEEELSRRINAQGPAVLAAVAKEKGIKLLHISTDYVFPGTGNTPICETDLPAPDSVYGRTKLEGEQAIKAAGCDAAVIRTAWLYSEFGNNFVKTMLRVGKERGSLNVVYDQTGTPTYAPDLARAVISLIENGIQGFQIYHYTNEGVASWYDFAAAIFDIYPLEVKLGAIRTEDYPTAARRPAYSVLSKQKIKTAGADVPYWRHSLEKCIETLKQIEK